MDPRSSLATEKQPSHYPPDCMQSGGPDSCKARTVLLVLRHLHLKGPLSDWLISMGVNAPGLLLLEISLFVCVS